MEPLASGAGVVAGLSAAVLAVFGLGELGNVVTVTTVVVGGAVAVFSAYRLTTMATLRQSNADLRDLNRDAEAKTAHVVAENARLAAENEVLKAQPNMDSIAESVGRLVVSLDKHEHAAAERSERAAEVVAEQNDRLIDSLDKLADRVHRDERRRQDRT